jgi:hypothetical protein
VANADVILAFYSGMTCHTLVHELNHDQLKTTKELLDIATRHSSGQQAVEAAFIMGNAKIVASDNHAAPLKATAKSSRKGAKGGIKGQKRRPRCVIIMVSNDFDEEYVVAIERDFKRQT